MSSKLSIAYDSIRSRDKAIEDLEGQIGALESDKYAALYFYEKAMKGREEWQGKAFAAEAEVAALKARVAELEAAARWMSVSEPPDGGFIEDAEYIVLFENAAGSAHVTAARYMKGKRGLPGAWVQGDGYLYEVKNVTRYQDMPDPPQEAPAP